MKVEEMKVKDLPNKLFSLIARYSGMDKDDLEELALPRLSIIDWTKATNDERLAYAELMYPVGTKFISGFSGRQGISDGFHIDDDGDIVSGHSDRVIYRNKLGKFAEIISRPEPKAKYEFKVGDRPHWTKELIEALPHGTVLECATDKDESIYNGEIGEGLNCFFIGKKMAISYNHTSDCYAKILSLPTQQDEFKAGEMVEACRPDCFTEKENAWDGKHYYFTGGIAKSGLFICQDSDGKTKYFKYIRKIQPDPEKKYRDAADKIMRGYYNYTSFTVKSMLIEALKKTI